MVENTEQSPTPTRPRRSLPEFQDNVKLAALSPDHRRSFRTKGRSSWSTSSDRPVTSPFGSASARSSLRSSFNRGSPSPARKLTTPQGPNLATASRQRQCRCSEVHHHAPHGHITPVDKRVPLERDRSCRRNRGASVEPKSKSPRTPRSSLTPDHHHHRERSSSRGDHHHHGERSSSRGDHHHGERSSSRADSVTSSAATEPPLHNKDDATSNSDVPAADQSDSNDSTVNETDDDQQQTKTAARKGSVTTMVKWVPWLAEKHYYTTSFKLSPVQPAVTAMVSQPRKGSAGVHHFKIIHTSSTAQPLFATSIGAPPGVGVTRLTIA